MKHYRRKKFFYKLFLRKSPRNAALFGVSLIALLFAIMPGVGFILSPYIFMSEMNIKMSILAAGIVFALWIYTIIVLKCAYSGMLSEGTSRKGIIFYAFCYFFALFYQLGGVIVAFVLFRQKRYFFALTGVISIISACTLIAMRLEDPLIITSGYFIWILALAQLAVLLAAIIGYRDKNKFKYIYLWPIMLLFLYAGSLWIYDSQLDSDIQSERNRISQQLGRSIELKDFWQEQSNGLQPDEEPLKSLLAAFEKSSFDLYTGDDLSQNERIKKLEQWKSENPGYVNAVDAFLKLRSGRIGHPYISDPLSCLLLPELNPLRDVARYLYYDISANCNNRYLVLKRNADLEKVRDWLLSDRFLIGKLVAMAVEKMRLNAMAYPLKTGVLTAGDLDNIISSRPNWGIALADAMGAEATMMQSLFGSIFSGDILKEEFNMDESSALKKLIPIELSIFFKRDYRHGLTELSKEIKEYQNPTKIILKENNESNRENRRAFVLSGMLLGALTMLHTKQAEMNDCYNLLKTAIKIMVYRNKHGRLPENLNFLGKIPVDSVNNQPFRYEHGKIKVMVNEKPVERFGYRLYTRDEAGIDMGGLKAKNTFTVILEP